MIEVPSIKPLTRPDCLIRAKRIEPLNYNGSKPYLLPAYLTLEITIVPQVFSRRRTLRRIFYATTPTETPAPLPIQFLTSFFLFFFIPRLSTPLPPPSPRSLFSLTLYKYLNAGYSPAERAFESSELSRPQANHRSPIVI